MVSATLVVLIAWVAYIVYYYPEIVYLATIFWLLYYGVMQIWYE